MNYNKSCGLHVHVSCQPTDPKKALRKGPFPWELDHIKRLHAFLYAFTPQLDTLHPSHRREGEYYCSFGTAPYYPTLSENIMSWLEIDTAEKLQQQSPGSTKYCTYNFKNVFANLLNKDAYSSKPTIEFRQHEATLDPVATKHWVNVCVGIVKYTREFVNPGEFMDLLAEASREDDAAAKGKEICKSSFTVLDLMERIGIPKETVAYYAERGLYTVENEDDALRRAYSGIGWDYIPW